MLELANNITHQISNEVFDIDNETFSLTTSIGVTLLNENVPSVERALERSQGSYRTAARRFGSGQWG